MAEKEVQVQFRLGIERRRRTKIWAAQHGTSIQALLERGLVLAMAEIQTKGHENDPKTVDTNVTIPAYNLVNPEYREWIDFAIDIFNSGKQDDIDGLIFNILAFRRGDKFDQLYALLADLLKTLKHQGVSPNEAVTAALTEADDFTRTLARARNLLKHADPTESKSGGVGTKRTG